MKNSILGGISLLLLVGLALPANAAETLNATQVSNLAYQGQLRTQGINGYSSLVQGVLSREVTGQSVVEAAVAGGRLPESALQDAKFISNVNSILNQIARGATNS
ncbi:hypothetical protein [Pseudanabaena sp. FACHB-2040]|uniref:hypothetical protein n=1 Tax=Pseudanabaena sp. FACHB-2040 TaxID=2692859 RepID=UPI0016842138|nr:hypothetical protein [Pseudanabaena sp. FACHB-2040]MBD2258603.1 hypothetical protein [Pseudanabaena sp. FACHB-2040]